MVISALAYVPQCYSAEDGFVINRLIRDEFANGRKAIISLAGVGGVPSSFVNAAFVSLLEAYNFDFVKQHLLIIDASKQAADMVRRCFQIADAPSDARRRA